MSESLHILLVEDKEADAILIQRELRRQGLTFTVRRVENDVALIQALRAAAPDLVLSDFSLPGFSGLEALAILRKERPGVPLIFVSGTVGEEQAVELLKLGATDYVLKDNLSRLPASVSRALREVQLETERRQTEAHYRGVLERMEAQVARAQQPHAGIADNLPAAAAHDLNNILAPIPMAVDMLRGVLPEAERERMYSIIEHSARRATEITRAVLAGSAGRGAQVAAQPFDLGRVIKEVVQKLQPTWPETLRVKLTVGDDLWHVPGDATQIERVITDLCFQAKDAMPNGGTLRLSAVNHPADAGQIAPSVLLEVSDTRGKAPRPPGDRTEPNLEVVRGIVRRQGGTVEVVERPAEGTSYRISLPAAREGKPLTAPAEAKAVRAGKCILLVDDEEAIRFAARAVLSKAGYRVLTASDGADALKVFDAHAGEIVLILTDVMMPVMDGLTLARTLRKRCPELPIIASSGQNETTRRAEIAAIGVATVLDKPYAADILLRTVDAALADLF